MSFNETFQKILIDILNISVEGQIERYTEGPKPYISKEVCTNDEERFAEAKRDAELVESARRRDGLATGNSKKVSADGASTHQGAVPMDPGDSKVIELTKEERDNCLREGLCLICREKGHLAKDCAKEKRNQWQTFSP